MKTREIKFRAWCRDGEWEEDGERQKFVMIDSDSLEIDSGPLIENLKNVEDEQYFMQYTGLKDRNGKDIYEGDIIQWKHYTANRRWWSTTSEIPEIEKRVKEQEKEVHLLKEAVSFMEGSFCLSYTMRLHEIHNGERITKGSYNAGDWHAKDWDFEIIGNIYENPELL